jgi:hypothetical protein
VAERLMLREDTMAEEARLIGAWRLACRHLPQR